MIYQMPCPGKARVFVASSAPGEEQARLELQRWASGSGYRYSQAERTFTVYGAEQQPRQWVLLERASSRRSGIEC